MEAPVEGRAGIERLWCLLQGKVEDMEQRTQELLQENQELKEHCASLRQQNTEAQAELQREQVQMLVRGELGIMYMRMRCLTWCYFLCGCTPDYQRLGLCFLTAQAPIITKKLLI